MMKTKIGWLLVAFTWVSTAVWAQPPGEWTQGEIEKVEIEIVRDKQITLKKAARNFEKIPPRPAEPIKPTITYEWVGIPFASPDYNPSIRPLRAQTEALPKLNGNYLAAGAGNLGSFYLEGHLNTKRDRNKWYGANVYHRSFGKGPVDGKNSAAANTSLNLFGTSFGKAITATGQVDYQNIATYFYGYGAQAGEVDRDTIRQRYDIVGLSMALQNTKASSFNYQLKGSFSYLNDWLKAAESDVTVDFRADYATKSGQKVLLGADYVLLARTDEQVDAKPRSLFRLKPAYQFSPIENVTVTAGFNLAIENDTLGKDKSIHVYPHVRASYSVAGEAAQFYAQLTGDIDKVGLHTLVAENRWVDANIGLAHTNRSVDFSGGVLGKLAGKFTYETGASFANLRNWYFFRNSTADVARFVVDYDAGNVQRVNVFATLGYDQSEKFKVNLRADYFAYSVDELVEAWHRPTYRVRLNTQQVIVQKLVWRMDLAALGGMRAFDPVSSQAVKLKNALDLGVRFDYLLSPKAAVFVKGENLLNNEYPLFFNYPTRGLQLMGGLTWTF
ncbi:MAG: hypothetical protein MUC38_12200 [Cyclobacteriaceae bacterium]|jgi:hypothetical protein|nr:hypothetical protein [Cyclobacteriaceae bacterium]